MKTIPVFAASVMTILIGGCAFGDRVAYLDYPPRPPGGSAQAAEAPATSTSADALRVVVGAFVDEREDPLKIGFVQNGYGIETADVFATNDVAEWVSDAMVKELEINGFASSRGEAPDDAYFVTGSIETVLTKAYFQYNAEIVFSADVSRRGEAVLGRRYTGESITGLSVAATGEAFGEVLTLALQDALQKFVVDLRQIE